MATRFLKPIHPGRILRKKFLAPNKLTPYRVAKDLGVTIPRVNDILLEKRAISPQMAVLLARYFGMTSDFFFTLQCDYDRRMAEIALRERLPEIEPFAKLPK